MRVGRRRPCYLHVGTHKTGTTTLQAFLDRQERWLARRGVCYPRAGRTQMGHHNLAWELYGDPRFDSRFGTLDALGDELSRSNLPVAALSSEDFCLLHDRPEALARLVTTIEGAGFEPFVVLSLRPQIDYVESLYSTYAQLAGRHPDFRTLPVRSFDDYASDGLWNGKAMPLFRTMPLEYDLLVAAFEDVLGSEHVMVRPYAVNAPPGALLESWLTLFGMPLEYSTARRVSRATIEAMRPSFQTMFQALELQPGEGRDLQIAGDAPFHAFDTADIEAWSRRFARSNDNLSHRLGTRFTAVTDRRLHFARRSESTCDEYHRALLRLRDGMRHQYIACATCESVEDTYSELS